MKKGKNMPKFENPSESNREIGLKEIMSEIKLIDEAKAIEQGLGDFRFAKEARTERDEKIKNLEEKGGPESKEEIRHLEMMNESSLEIENNLSEDIKEQFRKNVDVAIIEGQAKAVESFMQMPEDKLEEAEEQCSMEQIEKLEQQLSNLKKQKELIELAKELKN